ncbi:MAG: hypothetical protein EXQ59_04780 [Acidobacteria bacterium]|nr:hypothetical protein [Acidobacteriota bacterium]
MAHAPQTYKNHFRLLPPFHFFVLPVLFLNLLGHLRLLWGTPTLGSVWAIIVALALLTLAVLSRVQANTVQDRVIRLEMRQRLGALLPGDLQAHIHGLTPSQLVALRFASDAELPGLIREVLAGTLSTQKAIKMRVRDWQGDWLRA